MNREEIMELPAGEVLDALCAKGLGWGKRPNGFGWFPPNCIKAWTRKIPRFSSDPAASALLEDKLQAMGWRFHADGVGTPATRKSGRKICACARCRRR